jgi:hypothetical protein
MLVVGGSLIHSFATKGGELAGVCAHANPPRNTKLASKRVKTVTSHRHNFDARFGNRVVHERTKFDNPVWPRAATGGPVASKRR